MSSDGYGTISANLVERGTQRVRAILGNGDASVYDSDWDGPDNDPALEDATPDFETHDRAGIPEPTMISADMSTAFGGDRAEQGPADTHGTKPATSFDARTGGVGEPANTASNGARHAPYPAPVNRWEGSTAAMLRGATSATLIINEPASGDMSQVTVGVRRGGDETGPKPPEAEQRPTSVTYARLSLEEIDAKARDLATDNEPVWVDTPHFSGPDRRYRLISPECERRRSVPPRIKVGVRLEQERYLRLKLSTQETGRTQQDLITSAVDRYLDDLGIDRFERVAMCFGGVKSTLR